MIKLFVVFLTLTSVGCASIDLGYIRVFQESFKQNVISDLTPFYETGFSFIKAKKDNNEAIFILRNYDNGYEYWVGAGSEIIVTYSGLIVETSGLDHDIFLHDKKKIEVNILENDFKSYVSLTNPDAKYLVANFQKLSNGENIKNCEVQYIYKTIISSIGFNDTLIICQYSDGRVQRSIQRINPFDSLIEIDFYYQ